MADQPGILYVTMQPKSGGSLTTALFHDWYNNEHGPTRLRFPFVTNGFRYRATDLPSGSGTEEKPEWMAIYDIPAMEELTKEPYLRLRGPPVKSQREIDAMAQIKVGRKLYDQIDCYESPAFRKLEDVSAEGQENVLIALTTTLQDGEDKKKELDTWYTDEHIPMLKKVPGWLRTRRFVTSSIDPKAPVEYLTIHEYEPKNGLGGPEFQAATGTDMTKHIHKNVVKDKTRRVFGLYYTFGPAPRHLAANLTRWELSDTESPKTKTFPESFAESGAIESWVTTKDGVNLKYRLEGSPDVNAPLIVLSNSILVNWSIWDGFLAHFFSVPENKKYRVLRYLTRGRESKFGTNSINVNVLASDVITLLDALRVQKAAAVIGVSLGGATVLNAALKYPARIGSFISCDTSSKSPAGNSKAWGERIAMAENENAVVQGEPIVGENLAEATTRRWFVKESYDSAALEKQIAEVKDMVKSNSLAGFKKSVEALFEYDLNEEMKESTVKGLFVVGSGDGALPKSMAALASSYGKSGTELKIIDGAGHLPMVEKPAEFSQVVTEFL
jgi:pimeloyl-ACP methyl ester carboxylesterase